MTRKHPIHTEDKLVHAVDFLVCLFLFCFLSDSKNQQQYLSTSLFLLLLLKHYVLYLDEEFISLFVVD